MEKKILAGLSKLLIKKVRARLRNTYRGFIPYQEITFGELINYVNIEGLALCTDMKLKNKKKSELKESRKELGDFCV